MQKCFNHKQMPRIPLQYLSSSVLSLFVLYQRGFFYGAQTR